MVEECEKIKDLFEKDIFRELNGVIKVDQEDEKNIYTELEEYVITKETKKNLDKFFNNYIRSTEDPSDKIGVWVSGFFGSGKSHFVKILAYLLENRKVKDRYAVDFFKEKIQDSFLMSNIEKVVQSGDKDVILFNIDTKSNKATGDKKELIVSIMLRALNEKRGFSGEVIWLANLEEDLVKKGMYKRFKEEFSKINGSLWEDKRDSFVFEQDDIIDALVNIGYQSRESCVRLFEDKGSSEIVTVEKFARKLDEYIKSKGPGFQVVFLIDEIGQYIGEDSTLMLDLQSIVEELGTIIGGKAWVIVTSQADVDKITKDQVKGTDFSKIQGRFDTRLPLSSANVDEVIKRRILQKKERCKDVLSSFYAEKKTIIGNLICFERSAEMKNFVNADDFVDVYPFVPYQFNLLQRVFDEIRQTGFTGKHLAKGERSMLSAFKESAEIHGEKDVGFLVPFSSFYDSVESFIDPIYKRTIDHAKENSLLNNDDVELLKILFMIRHVKEIKATIDNLTILRVSSVDEDKKKLRESVAESIDRLEKQILIHKSQDEYLFLTNEEQAINKEIKNIDIDHHQIQQEVFNFAFNDIYSSNRFDIYTLNRVVDDIDKRTTGADLTVKFLTPSSHEYDWKSSQRSINGDNVGVISSEDTLLFIMPETSKYLENIRSYLQINKYLNQSSSSTQNNVIKNIYYNKAQERDDLKHSSFEQIVKSISESKVFICGKEVKIDRSNPLDRIKEGLDILVKNVFSKKDYIKHDYETSDAVLRILRSDDLEKYGVGKSETNKIARDEILDFVKTMAKTIGRTTLSDIKDRFMHKPYGWKEMSISGLVALLYIAEEVNLRYQKTYLISESHEDVAKYLTKSVESDKLLVEIREKTGAEKIRAVKSILTEFFDKTNIPEKETELFNFTRETINNQISVLEGFKSKYEEEERYPGREKIENYERFLSDILDKTDPSTFFDFIVSNRDNLKELFNEADPVKNFFESRQVEIFRRTIHSIDNFKRNIQFLSDEIVAEIKKMEDIISLDEPYKKITELPPIESKIEDAINSVLKEKKKEVLEKLSNTIDELNEELKKYTTFSDDFKKELIDPFKEIESLIKDEKEIALVVVQKGRTDDLRSKTYNKIEEQKMKGKDPSDKSYGKKTEYVSNTEIFRYSEVIETDEDLEEYLNNLRSKMKEMLKEKKIKVL